MQMEFPNLFVLLPGFDEPFNPKNWVSKPWRMHLLCQHPSAPHLARELSDGDAISAYYTIREAEPFWKAVAPWLSRMLTVLKYGLLLGTAAAGVYAPAVKDDLEAAINLAEEIVKTLPKPPGLDDNYSARPDDLDDLASAFGETVDLPALRAPCTSSSVITIPSAHTVA